VPAQPPDPRVRRSRLALEAALRDLIAERDLAQISVGDITSRAGVNRSTFYEHYAGVHDLAAAACTSMFDELITASSSLALRGEPPGYPDGDPLANVFAHVARHAQLYKALLGTDGSARVINHLLERMTVTTHASLEQARTGQPPDTGDAPLPADAGIPDNPQAVFIAGAVLATLIGWVRRGCPASPEQMAAVLRPSLISVVATALPGPPAADELTT
jgi:AcrR family transcriptional regulator